MFCRNCGKEIPEVAFCPDCGNATGVVAPSPASLAENEDTKAGNKFLGYIGISFAVYAFTFVASMFLGSGESFKYVRTLLVSVIGLSYFATIVLLITGKIKYPKNKTITILFWIMIVLVVLEIIGLILLILTCNAMINSCN